MSCKIVVGNPLCPAGSQFNGIECVKPTGPAQIPQQQQQVPTAYATGVTTQKDTLKSIQLLGTSPDNNPLQFSISVNPSHGTLSQQSESGLVTYSPNKNFAGMESFSFRVTDTDTGKTSSPAKVSITVTN